MHRYRTDLTAITVAFGLVLLCSNYSVTQAFAETTNSVTTPPFVFVYGSSSGGSHQRISYDSLTKDLVDVTGSSGHPGDVGGSRDYEVDDWNSP